MGVCVCVCVWVGRWGGGFIRVASLTDFDLFSLGGNWHLLALEGRCRG